MVYWAYLKITTNSKEIIISVQKLSQKINNTVRSSFRVFRLASSHSGFIEILWYHHVVLSVVRKVNTLFWKFAFTDLRKVNNLHHLAILRCSVRLGFRLAHFLSDKAREKLRERNSDIKQISFSNSLPYKWSMSPCMVHPHAYRKKDERFSDLEFFWIRLTSISYTSTALGVDLVVILLPTSTTLPYRYFLAGKASKRISQPLWSVSL